jgi:hypothetical protein
MPRSLTVTSNDGQFKVEMKAFKDWWFFYASIGSTATVFRRQQTKDTWGQTVTDWVPFGEALITINNIYRGSGLEFSRSIQVRGSRAELKEWAVGFFKVDIKIADAGVSTDTRPNAASLIVETVEAHIAASVPGNLLQGVVTASTAVTEQSTW